MAYSHQSCITPMGIREHFHEAFTSAVSNQNLAIEDETAVYVINLLAQFSQTQALYQSTPEGLEFRPLALLYGDALEAQTEEKRNRALKQLGDVALFISGIFADSLRRKLVDVDYYIGMGGSAYGYLNDSLRSCHEAAAFCSVFGELAEKFTALVDVLGEINERAATKSNTDVLRLYEVWLKTGSTRLRQKLASLGVYPSAYATSRSQH